MISHARFGALRLAQFLPDAEIAELENWEFMYHVWLGEAVGFSKWLRLENDPGVLRSLAIDFTDFPEHAAAEVLRTIELPVQRGMKLGELREILGEPVNELRLPKVKDRVTYEFVPSGTARYDVRCTVRNEGGLERINFRFAHIRKANHSSPPYEGGAGGLSPTDGVPHKRTRFVDFTNCRVRSPLCPT
jgi:hypothetical protein